ncbi:glycerate kinase [Corynebacterium lizhenjunii]|uniref:Glycerate kinase n=1 Tax=Corynebacterium lizhenjunii TaxID=2709394 RepID=A0A7T0KCW5_9CORY|nr:glycerate kinase [Corynebacterium lizhenjunii]QPK78456.1 glycerate kinase [Corynebacterium lizhenjunii]
MLVLVAPDSFKGTATAQQAAASIASGVRASLPDATVVTLPMADGGEGTAQMLADAAAAAGAEVLAVTLPVTDAIGRLSEATYYLNTTANTAYIDVAAATGLPAVADRLNPRQADSYGTGVLIADAEAKGATHIILGLGGSATIDGGSGILTALGAPGHDATGLALPQGGAALVRLETFDTAQLNMKAAALDYTLLADTRATPAEAAVMYGPQKGCTREDLALLTGAMLHLCQRTGISADTPSFGAAGCIPVGLAWLSRLLWGNEDHLRVLPGAQVVAQALGLPARLAEADLLITGEGRFDQQSLTGKVVGTLAQLAAEHQVPLALIAGEITAPEELNAVAAVELSGHGPLPEQLRAAAAAVIAQYQASTGK